MSTQRCLYHCKSCGHPFWAKKPYELCHECEDWSWSEINKMELRRRLDTANSSTSFKNYHVEAPPEWKRGDRKLMIKLMAATEGEPGLIGFIPIAIPGQGADATARWPYDNCPVHHCPEPCPTCRALIAGGL